MKFLQEICTHRANLIKIKAKSYSQWPLRGVQETQSLLQESYRGDRLDPATTAHSRLGLGRRLFLVRLSRLRLVSSRWQRVIFHCHCLRLPSLSSASLARADVRGCLPRAVRATIQLHSNARSVRRVIRSAESTTDMNTSWIISASEIVLKI